MEETVARHAMLEPHQAFRHRHTSGAKASPLKGAMKKTTRGIITLAEVSNEELEVQMEDHARKWIQVEDLLVTYIFLTLNIIAKTLQREKDMTHVRVQAGLPFTI
jgi:hypothetical protein